jgi:DNA-binding NtrC family response regulator
LKSESYWPINSSMKGALSILIIEDDKYCRLNLREILQSYGIIDEAVDVPDALNKLKHQHYDIVLTDIELGNGSGVELIPTIIRKGSHCIVVSSYESDEVIEKAYTLGASHYLSKLKLREQLPVYITKFLNSKTAQFEKFIREDFITQDQELINDLKSLCSINLKGLNLFISGPTGAGKSLLGKLIHQMTHPEAPLVHLNCSEVADNLLESELFGHEKGAFTGAESKKDGKLKLANNGTLFLDEVATMSLSMQQKLLKALDEKSFYPVGSSTPVKSHFTLISATCEDLHLKVAKKEFREDLYYRLCGFRFDLKPLSQRSGDVEMLIRHFQKTSNRRFVIKTEAMELLKRHPWQGNVRELSKICEAFSQSITGIVDVETVRKFLHEKPIKSSLGIEAWEEYVQENGLRSLISNLERRAVEESLKRHNGKITAAIKELKISSSAFYRILQEHQLSF